MTALGVVGAGCRRVGDQLAGVSSEPHGGAHVGDAALLGHQVDDRMRGESVELGGVGRAQAHQGASGLDDHHLHTEAQAQVRHAVHASVLHGVDHALDAALPEASGNDDTHCVGQVDFRAVSLDVLGWHPAQVDAAAVCQAGVGQRLADGEIRVWQLDVLADDGNGDDVAGLPQPVDHVAPGTQVTAPVPDAKSLKQQSAEPFVLKDERHLVDAVYGREGDDALPEHVAVDGDLVL